MSNRFVIVLVLQLILMAGGAHAQEHERATPTDKESGATPERQRLSIRGQFRQYQPRGYRNVLTANFPAVMMIQASAVGGGGIEYERFIDKNGILSVSLAGYALRSFAFNKMGGPREILSALHVFPAILYHPFGNQQLLDFSAGVGLSQGRFRRGIDSNDRSGVHAISSSSIAAVLGQLNLTLHHINAFVLGVNLSAGSSVLPADRERFILQGNLKIGLRF